MQRDLLLFFFLFAIVFDTISICFHDVKCNRFRPWPEIPILCALFLFFFCRQYNKIITTRPNFTLRVLSLRASQSISSLFICFTFAKTTHQAERSLSKKETNLHDFRVSTSAKATMPIINKHFVGILSEREREKSSWGEVRANYAI